MPQVTPTNYMRGTVTKGEGSKLGMDGISPSAESQEQAMKSKSLVAVILLLSCGTAFANQEIASVQVRPGAQFTVQISCSNPTAPSPLEVERLLQINDRNTTDELSHRLMAAAAEACNAGVASIVVNRAATGHSVTWAAAREVQANVAAN